MAQQSLPDLCKDEPSSSDGRYPLGGKSTPPLGAERDQETFAALKLPSSTTNLRVFSLTLLSGLESSYLMMELALITPPVGMNLYVVQGIRGEGPVMDIFIGVAPFIAMLLCLVFLIVFLPGIVTDLDHHSNGGVW